MIKQSSHAFNYAKGNQSLSVPGWNSFAASYHKLDVDTLFLMLSLSENRLD